MFVIGFVAGVLVCVAAAVAHMWRIGRELVGEDGDDE
jgi:hypothetical protein